MDLMTIIGIGIPVLLFGVELVNGKTLPIFINAHGILLVVGGTLSVALVNTSMDQLTSAFVALKEVFFPRRLAKAREVIPEVVHLAEKARRDGITSLVPEDRITGDGFLTFAIRTALANQDSNYVRTVLEDAIRQTEIRHSKSAAIFQTAAATAPMFGLLGTLVGIVYVLKDIANPQAIGPSMAMAITTAFYGIALSCLFTPIVGKLRMRSAQERQIKELVTVGMLDILAGMVPIEVERHLQAFLSGKDRQSA